MRFGTATAALIEQQNLIALRVEQLAMIRCATTARPAVDKYRRLTVWIAAQLPVDPVPISSIQPTAVIGG
ncbi:hypothetical protein D3C75_1360380 [compost metagenome]